MKSITSSLNLFNTAYSYSINNNFYGYDILKQRKSLIIKSLNKDKLNKIMNDIDLNNSKMLKAKFMCYLLDKNSKNVNQEKIAKFIGVSSSALSKKKIRTKNNNPKTLRDVLIEETIKRKNKTRQLQILFIDTITSNHRYHKGKSVETSIGLFYSIKHAFDETNRIFDTDLKISTVRKRIYEGWPIDQALGIKPRQRGEFTYGY